MYHSYEQGVQIVHKTGFMKHPHVVFGVYPIVCCAGPIPEAFGALTNLTELDLRNNQLAGKPVAFVLGSLRFPARHLSR